MLILYVFFGISLLYLVKIVLFYTGARRASARIENKERPSVSLIVAARNEEDNIDVCLSSLAAVSYSGDLEIIVVDDQSTDGTTEIIQRWVDRIPHMRMMKPEGIVNGLRGKANAIAQAIEKSSGDIVLTTDADCTVPIAWVERMVEQYDEGTGCVCGFTLIKSRGIFSGMQSLDWAYLLTIASAGVGWGYTLSAVGNNMSYRRAAYEEVGGYKGVGFSVTEDFALLNAIAYTTAWNVRYPMEASTLVWSEPCPDMRELYRQKKRWGKGGVDIHPVGFGIMSIGFLMSAAILLLPWLGLPLWALGCGLAAKCCGDAFLLSLPLKTFSQRHLYRYFAAFELYYLLYVVTLPFVVLFAGRVVWKDRKL